MKTILFIYILVNIFFNNYSLSMQTGDDENFTYNISWRVTAFLGSIKHTGEMKIHTHKEITTPSSREKYYTKEMQEKESEIKNGLFAEFKKEILPTLTERESNDLLEKIDTKQWLFTTGIPTLIKKENDWKAEEMETE